MLEKISNFFAKIWASLSAAAKKRAEQRKAKNFFEKSSGVNQSPAKKAVQVPGKQAGRMLEQEKDFEEENESDLQEGMGGQQDFEEEDEGTFKEDEDSFEDDAEQEQELKEDVFEPETEKKQKPKKQSP